MCPYKPVSVGDCKAGLLEVLRHKGGKRAEAGAGAFQQHTRITVDIDNAGHTQCLVCITTRHAHVGYACHHTSVLLLWQHATNKVLQSYTIVAVRPGSEEIFKFAVSSGVVDVVSFDLGQELPFYIRKPQVRWWCGWRGALLLFAALIVCCCVFLEVQISSRSWFDPDIYGYSWGHGRM